MTTFGDKLLGTILPTRDGPAQGAGAERVMLNVVGGPGGIRTRIVSNPDGTTTMLRTRNGMPEFSTSGQTTSQVEPEYERGFVARVQTKALGALFSPYTLAVSNPNYRLVNVTYTVLSFASTHNVAYTDTTHWHDVLTFQGNTIRVNGKKMPALVMGGFVPGSKAIPWLIPVPPPYTGLARYGDKATNATIKRVFSVRRDEVKSWGGGGVVETLTPTTPRTAGKALTVGPRIDPATNKAYLGQLFFSGDSWDDIGGEWGFSAAEVAMLLTAPYLTKVSSGPSVAMPIAAFGEPVSSSGTLHTPTTLPPTAFGMSAVGGYGETSSYYSGGTEVVTVWWIWNAAMISPLSGSVDAPYTRNTYSKTETLSVVSAGVTLDYSATNSINYDVRSERTSYDTQTINFPDGVRYSATGDDLLYQTVDTLYMASGLSPGGVPPCRGASVKNISGSTYYGIAAAERNHSNQAGEFFVAIGVDRLVSVVLTRNKSNGEKWVLHPNTSYYDRFLGEVAYNGDGLGNGARTRVRSFSPSGYAYQNSFPFDFATQPSGAKAAIVDFALSMGSSYAAQIYYDSEGVGRPNDNSPNGYYTFTLESITEDDSVLTWSSKDYLLYDVPNGVYISIEGSFAGANTSSALSVILRVKTRHHEVVQNLHDSIYSGQVLPEALIDTGRYAIPSPQIRAIFAPLYQEQGSFKGAHYVTALEEANGATPFHGFNFILRLKMYGDLATLNQQNDANTEVGFIPCNLLEMLYAFVFSQAYGVAETGERYPVWYPARFTAMRDGLFTNPIRVNIRNGVNADWLDTLGAPYIDDTTTELYRT